MLIITFLFYIFIIIYFHLYNWYLSISHDILFVILLLNHMNHYPKNDLIHPHQYFILTLFLFFFIILVMKILGQYTYQLLTSQQIIRTHQLFVNLYYLIHYLELPNLCFFILFHSQMRHNLYMMLKLLYCR
jgi:hypothetical protein